MRLVKQAIATIVILGVAGVSHAMADSKPLPNYNVFPASPGSPQLNGQAHLHSIIYPSGDSSSSAFLSGTCVLYFDNVAVVTAQTGVNYIDCTADVTITTPGQHLFNFVYSGNDNYGGFTSISRARGRRPRRPAVCSRKL
jgi:hypothetical protein